MNRLHKWEEALRDLTERSWLRSVPPPARRALLYGCAVLLFWAGWARYHALLEQAELAAAAVSEGAVRTSGELGGDRLREGLLEDGFSRQEAGQIFKALNKAGGTGRIYKGDHYSIVRSTAGEFLHLTLTRGLRQIVLTRDPSGTGFKASASDLPMQEVILHGEGEIKSSLWLSMTSRGIPDEVVQEFADVFQWTIDFLTEPREGDRFAVAWSERKSPDGRLWDRVIHAGLYDGKASGRNTGIRFRGFFYDENGDSLERMFLRAPLNYRRISSHFSLSRRHPILRKRRPHHGIDYAAPHGTPVVAVGDGRVTEVGWQGGFGKRIEVRHSPVYTTLYGHLSRYANGVQPGARVRQGQVIGYVGATGLASGPHLHFQIAKHGSWVNFLRLNLPKASAVSKEDMPEFSLVRDRYVNHWEQTPLLANGGNAR